MSKRRLIFGVSGQCGSCLAKLPLSEGCTVFATLRDAELPSFRNLFALGIREPITLMSALPADFRSVMQTANDETPSLPSSQYATAKASGHSAVANYCGAYGVVASYGFLFNYEAPLRPPRFVPRKGVRSAARIPAGAETGLLTQGDLEITRDWGWDREHVDLIWHMLETYDALNYVVATGHRLSLRDFVAEAFAAFGPDRQVHVHHDSALVWPWHIIPSAGEPSRAEIDLRWKAELLMPEVVQLMAFAERKRGR